MSHKNYGIINFSTIRIAAALRYEKFSHHSIAAVIFSATLRNFQLISNFNHESQSIIKFCSKNSVFRILLLATFFAEISFSILRRAGKSAHLFIK